MKKNLHVNFVVCSIYNINLTTTNKIQVKEIHQVSFLIWYLPKYNKRQT